MKKKEEERKWEWSWKREKKKEVWEANQNQLNSDDDGDESICRQRIIQSHLSFWIFHNWINIYFDKKFILSQFHSISFFLKFFIFCWDRYK